MTDLKPRGRPRTVGTGYTCDRCGRETNKIRLRWPDGKICGICFTTATHTYGECPGCGHQRMLPGRLPDGQDICRDCAGITTNLNCTTCGREAERFRNGSCITCVLTSDLTAILKPNDPPDLRLHRLIKVLTDVDRPQSVYTWLFKGTTTKEMLRRIGERELQLTHETFDALPRSHAVEHLRAILTHHHMLPPQEDRQLAVFEQWLDERLEQLKATPEVHSPIERFSRWHHLRRLKGESSRTKNMNYATRSAKQEITEAGKFLLWLKGEHGKTAASFNQAHVDEYLAEGPSTRRHIRNFVRYLKEERTIEGVDVPIRYARTTPMITQRQRLEHITTLMQAVEISDSTRVAGLLFLLYGIPIGRLCMLTTSAVEVKPTGTTITLGKTPAPIPEPIIPLLLAHLNSCEGQQTVNTGTDWLFPGLRAGRPRSPNTLLLQLRNIGINIQGVRNTTIRRLVEEIDPTSLAQMTGYGRNTLARHATAATIPWSTYVVDKNPHLGVERGHQ